MCLTLQTSWLRGTVQSAVLLPCTQTWQGATGSAVPAGWYRIRSHTASLWNDPGSEHRVPFPWNAHCFCTIVKIVNGVTIKTGTVCILNAPVGSPNCCLVLGWALAVHGILQVTLLTSLCLFPPVFVSECWDLAYASYAPHRWAASPTPCVSPPQQSGR